MHFFIKILLSAIIIASVSEIAKRSSLFGALTASLPLTSLLALVWLYYDTHDNGKIIELSYGILWLVIPSLAFFVVLPLLLKYGLRFGWSMALAALATTLIYLLFVWLLRKFGMSV